MNRSFEGRINGRSLVRSWVFGDSDSNTDTDTKVQQAQRWGASVSRDA